MKYYVEVPEKINKFPRIPRIMLPTSIDKYIKQAVKKNYPTVLPVKQFISTKDLEDITMLAQERCVERLFKHYMFHLRQAKNIFANQKSTGEEEEEEEEEDEYNHVGSD